MPKKYVKGKDGKFKGSLPDPTMLPKPPASNSLPPVPVASKTPQNPLERRAENRIESRILESEKGGSFFDSTKDEFTEFYERLGKERYETAEIRSEYLITPDSSSPYLDARVDFEEDDYCVVIQSKKFKGHGAVAKEDEENPSLYSGVVSFRDSIELATKQFSSLEEAKPWLISETNKRTRLVSRFKEMIEEDDISLLKTIESRLVEIGREDLVPLNPRVYASEDGVVINGSKIRIKHTSHGYGSTQVEVDRRKHNSNDPYAGLHAHYYKEEKKSVMFGLFVALSE